MAFWGDSALLGDKIIFGADDGVHGCEVWVADATASEPTMVKDILAGGSGDSSSPSWFTRFGDYVYFQANDGEHGYELWRTDGTAAAIAASRSSQPGRICGTIVGKTVVTPKRPSARAAPARPSGEAGSFS